MNTFQGSFHLIIADINMIDPAAFTKHYNITKDKTVSGIKKFINDNKAFVIFGASDGGLKLKKVLEQQGKVVKFFLDNDLNKHGLRKDGVNIYHPDKIHPIKEKILISSDWYVDIAKQLHKKGLQSFKDFVPLFDLKIYLTSFMNDGLGFDLALHIEKNKEAYQNSLNMLEDDKSKQIYQKLLKFRMLSLTPELINKQELPFNKEIFANYSSNLEAISKILPNELGDLKVSYAAHYALRSYRFNDLKRGDIVIDAGAWMGDSAYWFSKHVGAEGIVYSFEPFEAAYTKLSNVIAAMGMEKRIIPIRMGLSNKEGNVRFSVFEDSGTASFINEKGNQEIKVTTIDDFARCNNLEKVDFIKMDIEGDELEALEGAKEVIKNHKPKLAISIYHKAEHFYKIPHLIKSYHPDYMIFIDHPYLTPCETVCYAVHR